MITDVVMSYQNRDGSRNDHAGNDERNEIEDSMRWCVVGIIM